MRKVSLELIRKAKGLKGSKAVQALSIIRQVQEKERELENYLVLLRRKQENNNKLLKSLGKSSGVLDRNKKNRNQALKDKNVYAETIRKIETHGIYWDKN